MNPTRVQVELLAAAGRLLLEFSHSARAVHRSLAATAAAFTSEPLQLFVSYRALTVSLGAEGPILLAVGPLRYNSAIQARVHAVLQQVQLGGMSPAAALQQLGSIERDVARPSRWLITASVGLAASSLALLLGADLPAAAVVFVSSALGLWVRQRLGDRHFNALALPFAAALVGALVGGVVIRLGWTSTPELVLAAPALMLVPGPHLLNGVFDLIDDYVPMGMARLALAAGILLASAMGLVVGATLTLAGVDLPQQARERATELSLPVDMVLAGVATYGFAMYFNASWLQVCMAVVSGMIGHGGRFIALASGYSLEAATLFGGIAVGCVAAWMTRSGKTSVSVVAFAGAVSMVPGLHLYHAIQGAWRLAHMSDHVNATETVARTVGLGWQGCGAMCALALGLVLGVRGAQALTGGGGGEAASL